VTLTVADTGPGIAPAHLPFIFNRFYRADAARTGEGGESGLGLAIVKALVEAHGGTIEAQSDLGRGTTFAIHLAAYGAG
jgi:signal transduction histidine kinase